MAGSDPLFSNVLVFKSSLVCIGAFRCHREYSGFQDTGPARHDCFVFPRTAVAIEHEHEPRFAANPNVITFYNKGQRYLRHAVSDQGDRCDWFGIDRAIVREAVGADRENPFAWTRMKSEPEIFLQQRRIFEAAMTGSLPAIAIEEKAIRLLEEIVPKASVRGLSPIAKRSREMIYEVENFLGARLDQPLRLADIAAGVGSSAFHLCRTFRTATRSTIHRYLTRLRVRAGLERICLRPSLSAVALDLGFTHHSHFSNAFRREFGATPSAIRAQLTS